MSAGFTASASVCPTTQVTVLQAIVRRLQAEIAELFASDSTCFVCDVPWPGVEVNDDLFCTVCVASSQFDPDLPIGAARGGIVERGQFKVTVWSRLAIDRLEQSTLTMTDPARGLLRLKQRVLTSLAGRQLYADAPGDAVPLLIEFLRPVGAQHPASRQDSADYSSFSIQFEAPFYWDLT
jgi:hypothetical protein